MTISGTQDNRAFTAENGNLASEGIMITKGTANAFTKSVKADTVDYEIYSSNNAAQAEQVYLLDTMPFDGQNGSTFAGTYHVTAWKLDTTLCDASKLHDPNSPANSTDLFCNLQYMDENGKTDHNDHHVKITKNGGWVHFSARQTVSANSTDRSKDLFTVYSNPYNHGKADASSCFYYLDNVKVTVVDNESKQLSSAGIGLTGAAAAAISGQSAAFLLPTDAESKKSFLNK